MAKTIGRCSVVILLLLAAACGPGAPTAEGTQKWPYDENADAAADVARAFADAGAQNKHVLMVFGANWCPDCRVFDAAMSSDEVAALLSERFEVVKIDVGNWDKHLQLNDAWGDPIGGGIPAVVVADHNQQLLYSTKAGELAKARSMGEDDLYRYFAQLSGLQFSALPAASDLP